MEGWKNLKSSLNLNKFVKGFDSSVQATRERLGQVAPDEITELPREYKDLENRVDGLRNAHIAMLKISNIYSTESYDYPSYIQESISELACTIGAGLSTLVSSVAQSATSPVSAPVHKTLPHALMRASFGAAQMLPTDDHLGRGLAQYASSWDKIAEARVDHDARIQEGFLSGWQSRLQTSLGVAMKARAAVRSSRLELDAAKQTLKNAADARMEVENAEDDLVQKTEVAITLMKTVLDDPESLKNLNELVKAQLIFFATAAEALQGVQGEIEEMSIAVEGECR